MTPVATTLDAVDRAFVWRADKARRGLPASVEPEALPVASWPIDSPQAESNWDHFQDGEAAPAAIETALPSATFSRGMAEASSEPVFASDGDTLVDRLLRAVPQAWANLAQRVEDAHRDGAGVIAITGARRGEGRTTVVECLARALVSRGRRVTCHASVTPERSLPAIWPGDSEDCIVLIDAGVWFPGGPLRRAWLARQSVGCHAAILVRRADQPQCAARGAALEAVGLKVLGEVLTMVPPSTSAIRVS